MSNKESIPCKPEGAPWLIPMLTVKDVPESIKFYEKAFGFSAEMTMPDDNGKIVYASMNYKGQLLFMLMPEGAWESTALAPASNNVEPPVSLYVYCDDVDALYKQATASNARSKGEPEEMFWGDRTSCLKDPDGHNWTFATKVKECTAPETAMA